MEWLWESRNEFAGLGEAVIQSLQRLIDPPEDGRMGQKFEDALLGGTERGAGTAIGFAMSQFGLGKLKDKIQSAARANPQKIEEAFRTGIGRKAKQAGAKTQGSKLDATLARAVTFKLSLDG